jgi:hypothetical protein
LTQKVSKRKNEIILQGNWSSSQKDGANSMWRNGSEFERLKNLRIAAVQAMGGRSPATSLIHLSLRLYAAPENGDLDNFITGICDGLIAAHSRTPIELNFWAGLPELAQPNRSICYMDDKLITRIIAERLTSDAHDQHYEVELEW